MIAIESFRKFHLRDGLVLIIAAALFALSQLGLSFFDPSVGYYGSLLIFGLLLSFSTFFVRKAGTGLLVGILSSLCSFPNGLAGAIGWQKVLVFAIAGLLFELAFLLLKLEIHLIPFDILLGTALAVASIPLSTLLLLSPAVATQHQFALLNIALIGFLTGLLSAVLAFLLWYRLKQTKLVLWFEYGS